MDGSCDLVERFVLPDNNELPSMIPQQLLGLHVALHVSLNLGLPVGTIPGRLSIMLGTPMPEATPHFDGNPARAKDNVDCPSSAWNGTAADPEAKSQGMKLRAEPQFGLRIS